MSVSKKKKSERSRTTEQMGEPTFHVVRLKPCIYRTQESKELTVASRRQSREINRPAFG